MKILVLAGGRGTRLWPLSRKYKPKQFQRLINDKTMLQETVERLIPLFSFKDIFISTNKEYVKEVKAELPKLPLKNIIAEPANRERVASIALFLTGLKKDDFSEVILVLPSDHLIENKEEFNKAILLGESFIKKNPHYILTLGAKPTFPDTGMGYIKQGRALSRINGAKIYKIEFFKEKPNLKRAKSYLKTKQYFWNTAIYLFTPAFLEKAIKDFIPDTYQRYQAIRKARMGRNFKTILEKEYSEMDSVSLEYSVVENSQKLAFLPVDIGWSDVGSWAILKDFLSFKDKKFVQGNYVDVNSQDVSVFGNSKQLVAGVGVKDLIVVITDDIILICNKHRTQKVKEIIKKLEQQKKFDYL